MSPARFTETCTHRQTSTHRRSTSDHVALASARAAPLAMSSRTRYLLTVNNVPHRKVATEARGLIATTDEASSATIHHGKEYPRGVELHASTSLVSVLKGLTLPERVYAVVLEARADNLPDASDPATLKQHLQALIRMAEGWQLALEAYGIAHNSTWDVLCNAQTSFAVVANRRGARFKGCIGSLELAPLLGDAINARFGWEVDLKNPAIEVTANLNDDAFFVSIALLRRNDSYECKTRGGLDPHVAWAMVHSAGDLASKPAPIVCDPMCGKGSLLFEALDALPHCVAIGLDGNEQQLAAAAANRDAVPSRAQPAGTHARRRGAASAPAVRRHPLRSPL